MFLSGYVGKFLDFVSPLELVYEIKLGKILFENPHKWMVYSEKTY